MTFFGFLAAGCARGIQLSNSQLGAGIPSAPTTTTISVGAGSGTVITGGNLIVFVRTSPFSFPQTQGESLMMADPFLEAGIEEVFAMVEE